MRREHRAAHDYLHVRALAAQQRDSIFHARDGGRHERGEADYLRAGLAHGLRHALGRHVAAEVRHVEVVVFEDDADYVLSYVVYVAVDGRDDELRALLRAALARELRAQHLKRRFRGLADFMSCGRNIAPVS